MSHLKNRSFLIQMDLACFTFEVPNLQLVLTNQTGNLKISFVNAYVQLQEIEQFMSSLTDLPFKW